MLLRFLFLAPVLPAVLLCLGLDGFESLAWLWLLPAGYVGLTLLLGVLIFLFILLCGALVNQDKPQEKDSPFYRFLIGLIAEAAVPILSVDMHTKGLENTPREGRFLLVCNHTSLMDPVLLLHCFKNSQLAFISKRENRNMFLVGKLMHKIQTQLINRENDREALKTILKCISLIKEDKASVAVFPEGYIHPDRKLHHFRSGVFKIAQKTKVPIVVCTLRGTEPIFRNAKKLIKSPVQLNLVSVVQPETYEALTTVELGTRIYEMMARDLGPENVSEE